MVDSFENRTKLLTNKLFMTKLKYLSTMVKNKKLIEEEVKGRLYLGSVSYSSV
jgi:hypothetical protein